MFSFKYSYFDSHNISIRILLMKKTHFRHLCMSVQVTGRKQLPTYREVPPPSPTSTARTVLNWAISSSSWPSCTSIGQWHHPSLVDYLFLNRCVKLAGITSYWLSVLQWSDRSRPLHHRPGQTPPSPPLWCSKPRITGATRNGRVLARVVIKIIRYIFFFILFSFFFFSFFKEKQLVFCT